MKQKSFRKDYKKKYGSTKNAAKAWNRRLEAQGRAKRKAERFKQKAFEDSLLHDQDPRERI